MPEDLRHKSSQVGHDQPKRRQEACEIHHHERRRCITHTAQQGPMKTSTNPGSKNLALCTTKKAEQNAMRNFRRKTPPARGNEKEGNHKLQAARRASQPQSPVQTEGCRGVAKPWLGQPEANTPNPELVSLLENWQTFTSELLGPEFGDSQGVWRPWMPTQSKEKKVGCQRMGIFFEPWHQQPSPELLAPWPWTPYLEAGSSICFGWK